MLKKRTEMANRKFYFFIGSDRPYCAMQLAPQLNDFQIEIVLPLSHYFHSAFIQLSPFNM